MLQGLTGPNNLSRKGRAAVGFDVLRCCASCFSFELEKVSAKSTSQFEFRYQT